MLERAMPRRSAWRLIESVLSLVVSMNVETIFLTLYAVSTINEAHLFFKPVTLHRELTDLLVQGGDKLVMVVHPPFLFSREMPLNVCQGDVFPLLDLSCMDTVDTCDLGNGFLTLYCLERHLCLKGWRVVSPDVFIHMFKILAHCPNSWVQYTSTQNAGEAIQAMIQMQFPHSEVELKNLENGRKTLEKEHVDIVLCDRAFEWTNDDEGLKI